MNLVFHGPAKACFIIGMCAIMVSAINDMIHADGAFTPLVLLGFIAIGTAFYLRRRMRRG